MTKNEIQSSRGNTEPKPATGKRVPSIRKSSGARATPTKLTQAAQLLSRAGGATMAELGTASGWQPHSIRAMLSGRRKKSVVLVKETCKSGDCCYRIEPERADGASDASDGRF